MRGKPFVFTLEQEMYIVENWGTESAHSMKKRFGCTWYAVVNIAKKYDLPLPESNKWTDEQINTLRILSENYHLSEIASMMGKSENAIYIKARRLGITLIQDRRKWTIEEEKKFTELWGKISLEALAKKLKRSVFSLKVKAIRLNLGPMIRNTDFLTVADISELLGVYHDRIYTTWLKLGLNLVKKEMTAKQQVYVITWEDLLEFLKNNQYEWDSRNVEVGMLGEERDWLIEKRKRDITLNPLWYRRWTEKEIKEAEELFKSKKSYQEIASLINRSEGAVISVLRTLGYPNPIYWQDEEVTFLKDNVSAMTYVELANHLNRTIKGVEAKAREIGYQRRLVKKGTMDNKCQE